ncbi:MAG: type II secretion system F family protein [Candidatus Omnitrophica bacterium]|nr:type II secretion system F family protein [Candidatus Omnitrophota bacterium]
MPLFSYQAKQGPTQIVEGTMQAPSQDEVVARLLRDGLVPMAILITPGELDGDSRPARRVRVTGRERRQFTRQLTSLLRAKMELVPAVTVLKEQGASRAVKELLGDMERHMRDGQTFSAAIGRHPRVFSPLFLSAIRAGEAAGKLDDILLRLVAFDEQREELESRLRGALAYPVLLLLIGVACLGFFIWVVVPRMAGLFTQLGGALPGPTRLLIGLSEILSRHWLWVLAGLAAIAVLLRWVSRQAWMINLAERVLKRIGFTRALLEAQQIGRFTRTLQLLLHSGLPVFQAMDVAQPTLGSAVLEVRMRAAQEHVKRGESIAESLRAANCFPPLVTQMIAVGESAGTLVDVLDELASYYERSLDETLRILTSLLEPLMILVMGLLVGFCVLAMVLPIFQMTQLVR